MKQYLMCKKCRAILSAPVAIINGNNPNVTSPEFIDNQPVTPVGTAYNSFKPYRKGMKSEPDALEFIPQVWMNRGDLTSQAELTSDASKLNGCCGLDGCDGPNIICSKCKEYIGTEMSDCWTSYLFIPDPNKTSWETK